MRFSTSPSSPTSTASARPGPRLTNSTCFSRLLCFSTSTTPAQRDSPDSISPASPSSSSMARRRPAPAKRLSIWLRSSPLMSPISSKPSTNRRKPVCVGSLPALVCGA